MDVVISTGAVVTGEPSVELDSYAGAVVTGEPSVELDSYTGAVSSGTSDTGAVWVADDAGGLLPEGQAVIMAGFCGTYGAQMPCR